MSNDLFPVEPEFASTEEAEAYDRWFRAKVQASLVDDRPPIPHAEVIATLQKVIDASRDTDASDPMAD